MTQAAQAPLREQPGRSELPGLVLPSTRAIDATSSLNALHAGLRSILVQWSHGKSTFGWLRGVGENHVEIRVRDGSYDDEQALIFSIAPLPGKRVTQEFRVSTEGRGLIGQIERSDTRILAGFRPPRDLWSWNDLRHFIEEQAALVCRDGSQRSSLRRL